MIFLTAVCDDRPDAAEQTAALAAASCPPPHQLKTECFFSPQALLDAVRQDHYAPQLAILDIEMPGMNGMELARELTALLPECRVVYISAYLDYAPEVYTTEHVWFLYKDSAEKFMGEALKRAVGSLLPEKGDRILLSNRKLTRSLAVEQLLYLERSLHSTIVHTAAETITVTAHPDELLQQVSQGEYTRCHQSYWVIFHAVREIAGNEFIMKNGDRVPISRSRHEARREYFNYLDRRISFCRLSG